MAKEEPSFYADEETVILSRYHDNDAKNYWNNVEESNEEDFTDLEELEFWENQGKDVHGCQIIRVVGRNLPATVIEPSRLRRFLFLRMHEIIETKSPYSIVYIHTGVTAAENSPGMYWLWSLYESLPFVCKQQLRAIYALHPAIGMRFYLWFFGGWLSQGLYRKITFVSRVEFLWDYMTKSQIDIPDFVMEHDKELESRPLMDYGFEVDPLSINQSLGVGHKFPLA